MRKRREALILRKEENFARTPNEQDSIDYFLGKRFYQVYKDTNTKPNIFDNRQSFLMKVYSNKETKINFLKSFNRQRDLIT